MHFLLLIKAQINKEKLTTYTSKKQKSNDISAARNILIKNKSDSNSNSMLSTPVNMQASQKSILLYKIKTTKYLAPSNNNIHSNKNNLNHFCFVINIRNTCVFSKSYNHVL